MPELDRLVRKAAPDVLEMFVVYAGPRDFPNYFVVRRWQMDRPTEDYVLAKTLDEARRKIPLGLVCLTRQPSDDPKIVETWF